MANPYKPELFRSYGSMRGLKGSHAVSVTRDKFSRLGALDDSTDIDPWGDSPTSIDWLSKAPQIITTAQTAINAQRVFDINLDRAAKGLAPLPTSLSAPTVNFGLSAETQRLVLLAGAALLVVMLLKKRA